MSAVDARSSRSTASDRGSLHARLAPLVVATVIGASSAAGAVIEPVVLADPAAPLAQTWTHKCFGRATEYDRVTLDGRAAIRATGRGSASGLYRDVRYRVADRPWLEWAWRVEQLQRTADIRVKDREDFAAAIFLIFGRPAAVGREVPTLAYVWTSSRLPEGAVVESPHHAGTVRHIVVRSGAARLGQWLHERRNLVHDFRTAFGREPPEAVETVALFTDSDQTAERVEAYYGEIRAASE